jgi:hypothetical protein
LNGVVIPELPDVIQAVLQHLHIESTDLDQNLLNWCYSFIEGSSTRATFISSIEALTGSVISSQELEQLILRHATIECGLKELAQDLAKEYRLWLLADIPPEWVDVIINRVHFKQFIPSNRILDWRIPRQEHQDSRVLGSRLLMYDLRPGSTLIVDRGARRAMAFIRSGYDAAIYVNAKRLRRDLGLWGICP